MPDYLLEIGTEELPSSYVPEAQKNLSDGLAEILRANNLKFGQVSSMSTPRRLAVVINDLQLTQPTTSKKVKGPPVATSFDVDGRPNQTATGFATKHGLTVEQLEREAVGNQTYLVAEVISTGKHVTEILKDAVPKLIGRLSGERMMRWGSSDFKFSRPIRWLVSLLDSEIVEFTLNNLKADRVSYGHRILHPQSVTISSSSNYESELLKAFVQVDPARRKETIEQQVNDQAEALSGRALRLSSELLDEVVNITEWPAAVTGDFETEYLDLPDQLIETVMVHHQKYFPVGKKMTDSNGECGESGNGNGNKANTLLPHFITISNNDRKEAKEQIKHGNERVLKARLADGRFFYFDDQKTPLSQRRDVVAQLTFQEGLGSYGDKVERMLIAAEKLSGSWGIDDATKKRLFKVLELCKNDLVTNLVRELPELQGFVGSWYASKEGQPHDVAVAIASHYAPRSADDTIPEDLLGQLASVIDKADSLAGLFAIGKRPTGSSDPFALRRQAQGLVDVLVDGLQEVQVNVLELLNTLLALYQPKLADQKKVPSSNSSTTLQELEEFLVQRVKTKLAPSFGRREIVDASLEAREQLTYLPNIPIRAGILENLVSSNEGIELVRAGVRIANILKSSEEQNLDPAQLTIDAEKSLYQAYLTEFCNGNPTGATNHSTEQAELKRAAHTVSEYQETLAKLSRLVQPINKFFDEVMVNDENIAIRKNRHALLQVINDHFKELGNFSRLQSVIV
ncbi:MAG TPA: glycine--tRNA ligase subunit beta [Oculatellaceae cyanobacterium]